MLQKMLEGIQPRCLCGLAHHAKAQTQRAHARESLKLLSHVLHHSQLALAFIASTAPTPGEDVALCAARAAGQHQPVIGQGMVEPFRECVHLGQVNRELAYSGREQSLECASDVSELRIAVREVVFAVQLFQKEPHRGSGPGMERQVGIGTAKPLSLEPLDGMDRCFQFGGSARA